MSYQPHHHINDPYLDHAATRQAHAKIAALDVEIADYKGDDAGLKDLKHLQGELVRRHGLPPPETR
jgi:hypothetical protein